MTERVVLFTNAADGYKLAVRADMVDAVTYDPDSYSSERVHIYLRGCDEPFRVGEDYDEVVRQIWGVRLPKEDQ